MSVSTTNTEFFFNEEELVKTNIFIIWLDQQIGKADACVLLKSSFFLAGNPTDELFERDLNRDDIDRSITLNERIIVQIDKVPYMFQAFEDIEKCFDAIKDNLRKRIFLITSGSKGKFIVPTLLSHFSDKFVPNYWIYVFCGKMNMITTKEAGEPTNEWAMDYTDNVLLFDHQDNLLTRLLLDMSTHLSRQGEHYERNEQYASALQQYQWSKIMLERYDKIDERRLMRAKAIELDQHCVQLQQKLDEEQYSAEASS